MAWFDHAETDLEAVRAILASDGPPSVAALHVQQALEKALKGFLIARGWKLKKTHDLATLLTDALAFDPTLREFRELCDEATEFYFADRYPDAPPLGLESEEVSGYADRASEFVALLRSRTSGPPDAGEATAPPRSRGRRKLCTPACRRSLRPVAKCECSCRGRNHGVDRPTRAPQTIFSWFRDLLGGD
ncbi:MAG: HEPN domain-containing protein [Thermoplasmatota archaeon]